MSELNLKQAAEQMEEAGNALLALSVTFRDAAGGGKASAGNGKAGSKPAAKPAPAKKGKAAEETELTIDEVREKLRELVDAKGKEKMVEALESVGAGKLSDVDESQYQELMDKAQELIEAEEEAEDPKPAKKGKGKPAAKKGPDEDDVKAKAQELVDADKKAELVKALKQFKAKKVSDLAEEDYEAFIEAADEALADDDLVN